LKGANRITLHKFESGELIKRLTRGIFLTCKSKELDVLITFQVDFVICSGIKSKCVFAENKLFEKFVVMKSCHWMQKLSSVTFVVFYPTKKASPKEVQKLSENGLIIH
jgi:hypothetical protein